MHFSDHPLASVDWQTWLLSAIGSVFQSRHRSCHPIPGGRVPECWIVLVPLAWHCRVPGGLACCGAICLARACAALVQRHALLRQLSAVEALGSATVVCSDKTGSLTQNAMTVTQLWPVPRLYDVSGKGYTPRGDFSAEGRQINPDDDSTLVLLLKTLSLCNDAYLETSGADTGELTYRMLGDPTEGALVVAAAKAGVWRFEVEETLPRVAEIPFDSERKRMSTIHQWSPNGSGEKPPFNGDPYIAFVKGAPDVVLGLCTHLYCDGKVTLLTDTDRRDILETNSGLASQALRVLGGAVKSLPDLPEGEALTPALLERDLVFVGLAGMIDPPRPEVKPAIGIARHAGIKTS